MSKKFIFWDLDGTLGFFEGILALMKGEEPQSHTKSEFGIRFGIKTALPLLTTKGYTHVITSLAKSDYVTNVLRLTGLQPFFQRVFCGDTGLFQSGSGKVYLGVLKGLDLSVETAKDDVIIIGDSAGDKPLDLPGTVFILDPFSAFNDAGLLVSIIDKLEQTNGKSFYEAFQTLYTSSSRSLGGNIPAILEKNSEWGREIPTISITAGRGIKRELLRFPERL
ncbi:MAG: HAD family hydrolase [Desulfobacteraceae bacterium]|nr:MAG: HAD family hydrolase [Desulfobacteraceae bacterium]